MLPVPFLLFLFLLPEELRRSQEQRLLNVNAERIAGRAVYQKHT